MLPFDGQFVHKTWPERTMHSELQKMYEKGQIDAAWWCTQCHVKFDVHRRSEEQLRHDLGMYLIKSRQWSSVRDMRWR